MTAVFEASEEFAKRLDEQDPLARFRDRFAIPLKNGEPAIYFNGNSLGLMPKAARELIDDELRGRPARVWSAPTRMKS